MLHEYAFLVTWKELTAFSTSANTALRFCNRRKEAAARWEACEGTHLLASTGRCLVNRRQKEGQSKQRKQPAVSHFSIKICLARDETHIKTVFCTFRVSENQNWKANEHQKASLQNWATVKSGERCHLMCQVLSLFSILGNPIIIKTGRKWKLYRHCLHKTETFHFKKYLFIKNCCWSSWIATGVGPKLLTSKPGQTERQPKASKGQMSGTTKHQLGH